MVELKGYRVAQINYRNQIAGGTQLKLQNQVKYNMRYADNENRCQGVIDFSILDADMNPIEVNIQLIGDFTFDDGDDKADIHTESFDQLFPFLRQIVNSVTSMSNMPILIPLVKLDKTKVQFNKADSNETSQLN